MPFAKEWSQLEQLLVAQAIIKKLDLFYILMHKLSQVFREGLFLLKVAESL